MLTEQRGGIGMLTNTLPRPREKKHIEILRQFQSIFANTISYERWMGFTPPLPNQPRPSTVYAKQHFESNGHVSKPIVAVEVGIAGGHNALTNLKTLNLGKYYLVDPLIPYEQDGTFYDFSHCIPRIKKLEKEWPQTTFLKMPSKDAVNFIHEPLDLVYLDGNHEYESVKEDIAIWLPKIKPGGVIAGHDFNTLCPGVIQAVQEEFGWDFQCSEWDWWKVKTTQTSMSADIDRVLSQFQCHKHQSSYQPHLVYERNVNVAQGR